MKLPRTLQAKAKAALQEAVAEVVENHRRSGRPLAIWKNGKVVWVSAKQKEIAEKLSLRTPHPAVGGGTG